MKKLIPLPAFLLCTIATIAFAAALAGDGRQQTGYILESEINLADEQPGPHGGGGKTTAYNFFSSADKLKTVFRKRTLKPGSSIGYHLQSEDEIYYIISGTGEMKMNGKNFTVKEGDAILTLPGSWHGLTAPENDSLSLIICYEKK